MKNQKTCAFVLLDLGGATVSAGTNRQLSNSMSMYLRVKHEIVFMVLYTQNLLTNR